MNNYSCRHKSSGSAMLGDIANFHPPLRRFLAWLASGRTGPSNLTLQPGNTGRRSLDIGAIEDAYRRYAGFYDFCFGAIFQPGRKAIVDRMSCSEGERVLEVGVGTGLSLPLYPRNVFITGIDISPAMLAQARARKACGKLDNVVQLSVMDAENMEFADSCFDRVVAMHVASVVPDPKRLVAEMRRVCKPNGQLVFVNHFHSRNPIFGSLESLLAPLSRQLGFRPDFPLDRFLDTTGLETMNIQPVNLFHFCTMVEARNNKRFSSRMMRPFLAASFGLRRQTCGKSELKR